jgi:hypothetical protein
MKAQLDNILMSSMIMWMDHVILKRGEAFKNNNTNFYPVTNIYNGFYTYGLPFNQIVCDSSIPNCQILSGVNVNNVFKKIGEANLTAINPNEGQVYFSANQTAAHNDLVGFYAVKDFNIYLTNSPDEEILFESQYKVRPKTIQTAAGLPIETITYPCIFLKNNGGENKPFAFGGQDNTQSLVRAIILADNLFNLDAVCGILKDTAREYVPLIRNSPFNNFGGLNNGHYNYDSLTSNIDVGVDGFYISEVNVSKIFANIKTNNSQVFPAFVDFTLENIRYPRL